MIVVLLLALAILTLVHTPPLALTHNTFSTHTAHTPRPSTLLRVTRIAAHSKTSKINHNMHGEKAVACHSGMLGENIDRFLARAVTSRHHPGLPHAAQRSTANQNRAWPQAQWTSQWKLWSRTTISPPPRQIHKQNTNTKTSWWISRASTVAAAFLHTKPHTQSHTNIQTHMCCTHRHDVQALAPSSGGETTVRVVVACTFVSSKKRKLKPLTINSFGKMDIWERKKKARKKKKKQIMASTLLPGRCYVRWEKGGNWRWGEAGVRERFRLPSLYPTNHFW